ncbi:hypothetical protein WJX73_003645 [Symbiochloris irregularis]|uniref:Uncharacterized protein n=1 Tax=Symbiochloris irregularis TaxID=706552 RepID=A0AAW1NT82_9CHLO
MLPDPAPDSDAAARAGVRPAVLVPVCFFLLLLGGDSANAQLGNPIVPLNPTPVGLPGFGNITFERVTDDSISWGFTNLEPQLDRNTGDLQSNSSLEPTLQIAPDLYFLSYVFSGASCAVVSFDSPSCSDSLAWFLADYEPIRQALALGASLTLDLIEPYGVYASACLGNCSNQAFPLNPDLYYTMVLVNGNLTIDCDFTFKLDVYSSAFCASNSMLTGRLPSSEPQMYPPASGPSFPLGIVPGLTYAAWNNVGNNFLVDVAPPGQYLFHEAAAITNARCIAFAIWSPTEPAANLPLYQAYLFSQETLTEALYVNGTYTLFRNQMQIPTLADCSGAAGSCNAALGQWTGAFGLSPEETYHLIYLPYESLANGTAEQQVFYLVQAFTSPGMCNTLQAAVFSAPSPAGKPVDSL